MISSSQYSDDNIMFERTEKNMTAVGEVANQRAGNDVTAGMTTEHVMRFKTAFYFVTAAILDLHTKSLQIHE